MDNQNNNQTCYIYLRVSTDEQAKEGFSLDNQKKACTDYAKNHDFHIRRVFEDDGKSARTMERKAFQELIEAVKEKPVEAVVFYKIDRFARNVSDFRNTKKSLEEMGVKLHSVLEGNVSDGSSLIANILASVAEWESDVNGQRTRDALMQKFREGWQPTPPPIGYQSVGGDREKKTCKPDPYEAPIVIEMFQLYATGNYSILELQEWLKTKNIVSKNGTGLGHSVIHTIIQNPFYHGLIRWHGESKIGKHKPIINKELFETCQYVAAKHRDFLLRRRVHNFLLRGFIICAECGQRYTAEWHHKPSLIKRGGKIAYYHCQKRDMNGCPAPYVEMEDLEGQVEKVMKEVQFSQKFIDAVVEKTKKILEANREEIQSVRQGLSNQKMSFEARRNKLEDALLDGTIERPTFKRKHDELEEKIRNLDIQIQDAEEKSKIDISLIEEVLGFTRNIFQTYHDAPPFLKRHYLRFFYEKILVKNKVIFDLVPTPIFAILRANQAVIITKTLLPRQDSNLQPSS